MSSSDNDALSLNRLPSDVINMIIGVGIEFVDSMKLVRPAEAINRVSRQWIDFHSSNFSSLEHAGAWLYQQPKGEKNFSSAYSVDFRETNN